MHLGQVCVRESDSGNENKKSSKQDLLTATWRCGEKDRRDNRDNVAGPGAEA